MAELESIMSLLGKGGTTALLVMVLLGGFRRWWVFGWHYLEMQRDRDEWKALALRASMLADRVVSVAEAKPMEPR